MYNMNAEIGTRIKAQQETLDAGIAVGKRECEDTKKALRAIIHAYDTALTLTMLPTVMVAAIEAARKHI